MARLRRSATPDICFVEGIYSQTGRATHDEITFLERSIDLQLNPPKVAKSSLKSPLKSSKRKGRLQAAASAVVAGHALSQTSPGLLQSGAASLSQSQAGEASGAAEGAPAAEGAEAAAPGASLGTWVPRRRSTSGGRSATGELAQAIAGRLRSNRASSGTSADHKTGEEKVEVTPKRHLSPQGTFPNIGMDDGPWTSKFTAGMSPGALNRWNEQRPDPGWYKVQLSMVHTKNPSWDFRERPKHPRRYPQDEGAVGSLGRRLRRERIGESQSAPTSPTRTGGGLARSATTAEHSGGLFLTSVDAEKEAVSEPASPKAASADSSPISPHRSPMPPNGRSPTSASRGVAKILEQMALASARPSLGRIGRVHVLMHETSHPAEDLPQQDIKGYRKLRYPEWDFAHTTSRGYLTDPEDVSCPGKYDVRDGVVRPRATGFVEFDRVMPRSSSVVGLGHIAPEAVLHPEEKRAPGACVKDRSRAKDCVRQRITNVNDYERDLGRPPPARYAEYHDTRNLDACESVLRFQMEYDADKADVRTTRRRDIAPSYDSMLPRGKDAVQGNRALSHDLGVRGSVGLGFFETSLQRERDTAQRECRNADSVRDRPDVGPVFEHYTLYQTTTALNNFVHGSAPVQGSGPKYQPKPSAMRRAGLKPFERKAEPGFTGRARLGGQRVAQEERAHEAMAILAGDLP